MEIPESGDIWKIGCIYNTYSGTPQGSLISPILANIYLNELDVFMAEYAKSFNRGTKRKINPAYKKPLDVRRGKQEWLKRNEAKISEGKTPGGHGADTGT